VEVSLNELVRVFTAENWEAEVLSADGAVLVDFWAEWCPPCRALSPLVDELAQQYAGRVKVGKVDVDGSPEVASRYGITSIPSLLVFQGGQVVAQRVGAAPRAALVSWLDCHVLAATTVAG
jgi:thioredoxin 1